MVMVLRQTPKIGSYRIFMTSRSAALIAAFLIGCTAMPADLVARPMTPEDVARIEKTGTIAISDDGTHIAYTTLDRPDVTRGEANGRSRQQLFLADAPMQARAYLPDEVDAWEVDFTPDGTMISYLHAGEGESAALWGVPVAGGAPRKLAQVWNADVFEYAFAPDGSRVYLLTGPAPDEAREMDAEAGFDAVVYEEEQRFNRLFAARLGATPDRDPVAIPAPGHVDTMQLAPDGTWLLVTSAPTTLVDDSYVARRPAIIDLATGAHRFIATTGKIGDIAISPDGRQLAMLAGVDRRDPAATTLHLVDRASGAFSPLNAGAAEAAMDAEWMADGRLAAIVDKGARSVLRFYDADGTMRREVDPGVLVLTRIVQGGNRLIAMAHAPTHPVELFAFDGREFTRWTQHNIWLEQIDFGLQRTITYTARDGQVIEGVLMEPVGGVPEGGAPTILDVHGGPERHATNGWQTGYDKPGQVAAGKGYAVFLPNYRGSTGYGTAFSKAHSGRYTDPEFTDLVDAKHALVDMGVADPGRTGMTGSSYGGYATAWSATYHSEEFAAGVMYAGITDQISKMGTSDIPREMYLVHARQWPWDDWQGMLEVSPIRYTDRANTPLLIMHGEADTRVTPSQSLELYRHIEVRRPETPLRLVLYPGEGHGNGLAAARYDYNLRMMEWFDTYLLTGDRKAPLPNPRPVLKLDLGADYAM